MQYSVKIQCIAREFSAKSLLFGLNFPFMVLLHSHYSLLYDYRIIHVLSSTFLLVSRLLSVCYPLVFIKDKNLLALGGIRTQDLQVEVPHTLPLRYSAFFYMLKFLQKSLTITFPSSLLYYITLYYYISIP